ncbi:hypothetical protein K1T71_006444 [Dendrolimus kikuchii]|uniref:Uncharacterized protein n=1 Tax=Dendrolimus kikuchii TaxID=765133 RepID=A0ACC1D0V4_9NEOP|nr:hypothetical protein K1T71_006444 [Dendrolimus kikuchii]
MVVGPKLSITNVEGKGRISIRRLQHLTIQKKRSVIGISYGILLVIISIIMAAINPLELVTNWILNMKEGSFLYKIFESPPYDIYSEIWVYNFTNVPEFLSGNEKALKVQEVGPFTYREDRTNENITTDDDKGTMTMRPKLKLRFVRDLSISDPNETMLTIPNVPLIALSTAGADKFGYHINTAAYYSLKFLGSKIFKNLTVEEYLWGYKDSLVTVANKLLPGWIDFGTLGLIDRMYAQKDDVIEVELKNSSNKYSIQTWNGLPGLREQGYTDFNSSIPCNRLQNTYEGLMVTPNLPKEKILPIFRRQACRVYPFVYKEELTENYGYKYYRYELADTAFSKSSEYACKCTYNCLPEGFVDISKCYYGFPIALSKLHYADVDPVQQSYFEGMVPNPKADRSYMDVEPTIGAPLSFAIKIQANIAVRMSPGNTLTKPLKDKVIPLFWLNIYSKQPPSDVRTLLKLRLTVAPPAIIVIEILLFIGGILLTIQAIYRIYRPRYKVVQPKEIEMKRRKSTERRRSSILLNVVENAGFKFDTDFEKEAVSLLDTCDDDLEELDLIVSD